LVDSHGRQCGDRLGFARGVPRRPVARMQPGMAALLSAERQKLVAGVFASTAAEAAAGRRAHLIAV